MIQYFEWNFDAEPLESEEPSEASVRDSLVEIAPMAEQMLRTITTVSDGTIQLQQFVEMQHNLAKIHNLSRILRN